MQLDFTDSYFELFGITPSLYIDQQLLDGKHRTLQAMLHPDRHVNAGDQQRRIAAQNSAFVNEAYRTLSDSCLRAAYLLKLKGIVLDTENETMNTPDFLMEQMELRENLQESGEDLRALNALDQQTDEKMKTIMSDFSDAYASDDMALAKTAVGKMQFISKLKSEISDSIRQIHTATEAG